MAKKNLGLSKEGPKFFLVNQLVAFASESRKRCAIAVAPFGYDLENFKIWLKIALHSRIVFLGVIQ